MSEPEYVCAVWYSHYGTPDYELYANEDDAAAFAYHLEDAGNGAVAGVQFADGRIIDRDDWPALDRYGERLRERVEGAAGRS